MEPGEGRGSRRGAHLVAHQVRRVAEVDVGGQVGRPRGDEVADDEEDVSR